MDTINERIAFLIKDMGISRSTFADRLHISRPFASELCTGAKQPSDRTISDICREFNVSLEWLQTGNGEMYIQRTANEELAMMVSDLMEEADDSFRKRFVSAFLAFPLEKLSVLEEFVNAVAQPPEEDSKKAQDE